METKKNIYWIDLFCGFGGATQGIHLAGQKVIACVNHDPIAIECHEKNHPEAIHFTEDITDWRVIMKLKKLVEELREREPDCIIKVWASVECTHFSKARGGLSREADSRTLAEHLHIYARELNPHSFYIENVEEFLTWGPLDNKGKVIQHLKGTDYEAWRDAFIGKGYNYDYRLLNSANYGARTRRVRYFGIFTKADEIKWPKPTHAKRGSKNPDNLPNWLPVRDYLNLSEEGVSVFGLNGKNKPWATATMKRVFEGMKKFHENEKQFLTSYYGNGTHHSIDDPCNTLTTKERYALSTIVKKKHWIVDTQFDNKGKSIDEPCQTLIARMDKKPPYLITSSNDPEVDNSVEKEGVRPIERLMRWFMRKHDITDVRIRMLFLEELIVIQGFPLEYILSGTKTDKLKFIGNSVVPAMAEKVVEINA